MCPEGKVQAEPNMFDLSKRYAKHLLDVISTEYNLRFRQQIIQQRLQVVRQMPRALGIEFSNICNSKCIFCAYSKMKRPKRVMPMSLFKKVTDEYIAMGGKYVGLTPTVGDPFVDSMIFDRLDYLDHRSEIAGFLFYTNASLMTPDISAKLMKYGKKLKILVSWGGFDTETYKTIMGFDRLNEVYRNVEAFIEAKKTSNSPVAITIAIRCPLSKCKGAIWERINHYQEVGLLQIEGHYLEYDSWAGKIEAEKLISVGLVPRMRPYKRGACEMLFQRPIILADGKVVACACRDVDSELIIGDINETSLADLWHGKEVDRIIEGQEQGDFADVCKRCTWYVSVYNLYRNSIFKTLLNWRGDDAGPLDTY